jgi:8-oxo-dGTP pyrophosphatase MutT (NUDIX family)
LDLPDGLARLRETLLSCEPRRTTVERIRFLAAVAVVLREVPDGLEVLLIRRTERPGDPWAGHMSFPGGRVEPGDPDTLGAAVREAREEVGVALDRDSEVLGRLSDIVPRGRGRRLGVVAVPHVFGLSSRVRLTPNPAEVRGIVWLPLGFLAEPRNRSTMWWWRWPHPVRLPCYRYRGHLVWGMTLRALDELVKLSH